MTAYLIKLILCSAFLLGGYRLLLEREKMHRFNRFYLLAGLLLSFVIPLFNFRLPVPVKNVFPLASLPLEKLGMLVGNQLPLRVQPSGTGTLSLILWVLYLVISSLMLLRFAKNLKYIFDRIPGGVLPQFEKAKLVLLEEKCAAHTFMNYIFVNREEYEKGSIPEAVLQHELTHARQGHSWDLILLELVRFLCWFNPIWIFYRQSIRLNHEFLCDQRVIDSYADPLTYQLLLINGTGTPGLSRLASQLNYQLTKKRLLMMTKTSSLRTLFIRQVAILALLAGVVFLFGVKSFSQAPEFAIKNAVQRLPLGPGADANQLQEYDDGIREMTASSSTAGGEKLQGADLTKGNLPRLAYLYRLMNKEQRAARDKALGEAIILKAANYEIKSPDYHPVQTWDFHFYDWTKSGAKGGC